MNWLLFVSLLNDYWTKKHLSFCNTSENQSYRLDAWAYFGGEEKFADALVLYFGGSYNHYRDSGELSNEENSYLKDYLEACTNS